MTPLATFLCGWFICGSSPAFWTSQQTAPNCTPVPAATFAPTPLPTYSYTAPTPQATAVPTATLVPAATPQATAVATATLVPAATPQPTYVYTVPTVAPVPTRPTAFTATYDPASLAANSSRCDSVTVTGIATGRTVEANAGVAVATGCVIAGVRASATNTVEVCWRNTFAATTACDTATSTWIFEQP